MSIRRANPDDLPIICALITGLAEYEKLAHEIVWTPEQLGETLFGPNAVPKVELAIDDDDRPTSDGGSGSSPIGHSLAGDVVGMALWYPTFSTFLGQSGIWLEDLFVLPSARGKGYGLLLLQHLRSLTTGRVEWSVLDWNEPSIRFYDALGARPVDGWTRYRWLP
jgi:GNAT superfamily N-acetyltransferase